MQMTHRSSDSPGEPQPLFSVIMLKVPLPQQQLMIPEKSAKLFGEKLSDIATITLPNNKGRSWKVHLKKQCNKIWFHEGIMKFLDHYSVQYFYNLNFSYKGDSTFDVFIFDELGSEIDYPSQTEAPLLDGLVCIKREKESETQNVGIINNCVNNPEIGKQLSGKKRRRSNKCYEHQANHYSMALQTRSRTRIKLEDSDFKIVDSENVDNNVNVTPRKRIIASKNSSGRRGRPKVVDCVKMVDKKINFTPRKRLVASKNSSRGRPKVVDFVEMVIPKNYNNNKNSMSKETTIAIRFASKLKLKNPSFMLVLKPYSFKLGYVCVPMEFERKHFCLPYENIQLEAHNVKRKKWLARCYNASNGSSSNSVKRISKSWSLFSADNKLKEGDVCVFELIKKTKMALLRVWIHRADDYSKTKSAPKRLKLN